MTEQEESLALHRLSTVSTTQQDGSRESNRSSKTMIGHRSFGTDISVNSPPPAPASTSKKVKVVRRMLAATTATQRAPATTSSSGHDGTIASIDTIAQQQRSQTSTPFLTHPGPAASVDPMVVAATDENHEYTIVFGPGPIGLQVESITNDFNNTDGNAAVLACVVQRFVDGGPTQPGPARATGQIQPGDAVVAVNGQRHLEYHDMVQQLKDNHNHNNQRSITFSRAWRQPLVDTKQQQDGALKTHATPQSSLDSNRATNNTILLPRRAATASKAIIGSSHSQQDSTGNTQRVVPRTIHKMPNAEESFRPQQEESSPLANTSAALFSHHHPGWSDSNGDGAVRARSPSSTEALTSSRSHASSGGRWSTATPPINNNSQNQPMVNQRVVSFADALENGENEHVAPRRVITWKTPIPSSRLLVSPASSHNGSPTTTATPNSSSLILDHTPVLTPSKVKRQVVRRSNSQNNTSTNDNFSSPEADLSSVQGTPLCSSVLKTVYRSVAAPTVGVVASGSQHAARLGSALVHRWAVAALAGVPVGPAVAAGGSNTTGLLEQAVERKHAVLEELTQTQLNLSVDSLAPAQVSAVATLESQSGCFTENSAEPATETPAEETPDGSESSDGETGSRARFGSASVTMTTPEIANSMYLVSNGAVSQEHMERSSIKRTMTEPQRDEPTHNHIMPEPREDENPFQEIGVDPAPSGSVTFSEKSAYGLIDGSRKNGAAAAMQTVQNSPPADISLHIDDPQPYDSKHVVNTPFVLPRHDAGPPPSTIRFAATPETYNAVGDLSISTQLQWHANTGSEPTIIAANQSTTGIDETLAYLQNKVESLEAAERRLESIEKAATIRANRLLDQSKHLNTSALYHSSHRLGGPPSSIGWSSSWNETSTGNQSQTHGSAINSDVATREQQLLRESRRADARKADMLMVSLKRKDNTIQDLRSELEESQVTIARLRKDLSRKETSNAQVSDMLNHANREKSGIIQDLSTLASIIDAPNSAETPDWQTQFQQACAQVEAYQLKQGRQYDDVPAPLHDVFEALKAQYGAISRQMALQDSRSDDLLQEVCNLRTSKDNMSSELSTLRKQVHDGKEAERRLAKQLDKTQAALATFEQNQRINEQENSDQIAKLREDIQERDDQLDRRDKELAVALDRLDVSEAQISQLQIEVERTENDRSGMHEKIVALERERVEARRREEIRVAEIEEKGNARLAAASQRYEQELVDARHEIEQCRVQEEAYKSTLAKLEQQIQRGEEENANFVRGVKQYQEELDHKNEELSAGKIEQVTLLEQLRDAQESLRQKSIDLDAFKKALDKAEAQYNRLGERFSNLVSESTQEKDAMTAELITLRKDLAGMESRNVELDRLIRSLRRTATNTDAELAHVRNQLQSERESMRSKTQELERGRDELQQKADALSKESGGYHEAWMRAQQECNDFKSKSEQFEETVLSLTETLKEKDEASVLIEEKLRSDIFNLKEQLGQQEAKVTELAAALSAVEADKGKLLLESAEASRMHEDELRLLQREAALRAKKHSELLESKENELRSFRKCREDLRLAREDILRLQETLRKSRGETEYLADRINQIQFENEQKIANMSLTHSEELQELVGNKRDVELSLAKTQQEISSLVEQLGKAAEELGSVRNDRERLSVQCSDLSSKLLQSDGKITELLNEISGLQQDQLDTSDEFVWGELAGMNKTDLRIKCIKLQEDLDAVHSRADQASEDAARRCEQMKGLNGDIAAMSDEIERMIESNSMLEKRMEDILCEKRACEERLESILREVDVLTQANQGSQQELQHQAEKNVALVKQAHYLNEELAKQAQELKTQRENHNNELSTLKNLLLRSNETKAQALKERDDHQIRLKSISAELDDANDQIKSLQTELSEARRALVQTEGTLQRLELQAANDIGKSSHRVSSLESECSLLRARLAETQAELESKNLDVLSKDDTLQSMTDTIAKQRLGIAETRKQLEEKQSELQDASRVIASQNDAIKVLESRVADADRVVANLSDQIRTLQAAMKRMESSAEATNGIRVKQLQDLELQCAQLEESRKSVRAQRNALEDDLRQARRNLSDYEKLNHALHSRIESMRQSIELANDRFQQARKEKDECLLSSRKLENELDLKQSEVDRLKGKIQMLNASVSRVKADYLLLKEVATKSDSKLRGSTVKSNEVLMLKSELQTQSSKLESLSEVYQAQQQILARAQALEGDLIYFIEDLIDQSDLVFGKVVQEITHFDRFRDCSAIALNALDLAGQSPPFARHGDAQTCISDLSTHIPRLLKALHDKRDFINSWKEKRRDRMSNSNHEKMLTPLSNARQLMQSPSILESFRVMKEILNEEVLSPRKANRTDVPRLDAAYLQKVIISLESQIDGLLADLRTANDALRRKDQLFADLEALVNHHESERDVLEEKVESMKALIQDLEGRLTAERTKNSVEQTAGTFSYAVSETPPGITASKIAAGRLIASFLEHRARKAKAAAFCRWACQTSANHALARQSQVASALTQELETTREKLLVLKRHLSKSRRNHRGNATSSPPVSLDSITEASEKK